MQRGLGKAPFCKQAIQILVPIYKQNKLSNKEKYRRQIDTSMHDTYLATRALHTGRYTHHTHACTSTPLDQRTFADLVTAKLPLAQNAADIVALINAYKVPFATFGNP